MKEEELKKEIKILKKFPMNKRGKEIKLMELSLIEIQKEAELKGFQEGRQSKLKEVLKIVEELKKVADENDMEIAIDDGEKDGFRVIDFSEYIEREFSLLSQLEDDEVKK